MEAWRLGGLTGIDFHRLSYLLMCVRRLSWIFLECHLFLLVLVDSRQVFVDFNRFSYVYGEMHNICMILLCFRLHIRRFAWILFDFKGSHIESQITCDLVFDFHGIP